MLAVDALNAPEALVLTMVLVSVADGSMTDREIGIMSARCRHCRLLRTSPASSLRDVTELRPSAC